MNLKNDQKHLSLDFNCIFFFFPDEFKPRIQREVDFTAWIRVCLFSIAGKLGIK